MVRLATLACACLLLMSPSSTALAQDTNDDPAALVALGQSLIQETRETADYSLLVRAEEAFVRARDLEPDDLEAILGLGSIALSRHDFEAALGLGRDALAIAPASTRAMGEVFDALIELGRYEEAGTVLQSMLLTRPDLSSYSRLSYYHELHGRPELAIEAMEDAVVAGGPVPENTEYARVILADLWLREGDVERARFLYRTALDNLPDFVPALRGLAETSAADGDLAAAAALLEQAIAHIPLPDLVVALAETQEAALDQAAADGSYRLAREIAAFVQAQGVAADPNLAVFEAEHGDPAVALELARQAYAVTPSVRAADALAWSLHANGQMDEAQSRIDEALRTGWQDPGALYHAGVIALDGGDPEGAVDLLRQSLARNPGALPRLAQRTQAALDRATAERDATAETGS